MLDTEQSEVEASGWAWGDAHHRQILSFGFAQDRPSSFRRRGEKDSFRMNPSG